jgi:ABC-type phosphate/phosphonate transport system substrate-binding protein
MMRAFLTCAVAAVTIGASVLGAAGQTHTEINFGVISTEASMNQEEELGTIPAGNV